MNSRYTTRFSTSPFQDYDNLRQSVRLSKLNSEPQTNGLTAQLSNSCFISGIYPENRLTLFGIHLNNNIRSSSHWLVRRFLMIVFPNLDQALPHQIQINRTNPT